MVQRIGAPLWLPETIMVLDMPEMIAPDAPRSRLRRIQGQAVKQALQDALRLHHRNVIKEHFKRDARHRYRHFPRHPATIARKQLHWGNLPDLVKRGRLRAHIKGQTPKIFARGSWGATNVTAVMTLQFPSHMRQFPGASGVTMEKMGNEIARFDTSDRTKLQEEFKKSYLRFIGKALKKRKRQRTEVIAALSKGL